MKRTQQALLRTQQHGLALVHTGRTAYRWRTDNDPPAIA